MRVLLNLAFGLRSNCLLFAPKLDQMLCGQDDSARGQAFSQDLEQYEHRRNSSVNAIEDSPDCVALWHILVRLAHVLLFDALRHIAQLFHALLLSISLLQTNLISLKQILKTLDVQYSERIEILGMRLE